MMNLFQFFRKGVINNLWGNWTHSNNIQVKDRSQISKDSTIRHSRILGDVVINEGCFLDGPLRILSEKSITINRFTSINGPNTSIYSKINQVNIGSFCSIAQNVLIIEHNHRIDYPSTYYINKHLFGDRGDNPIVSSKGSISIGNDVWIGANSTILSGSSIGNGSVVAANTLVTGNYPPFSIIGGNPGRVLKYRFDDGIIKMLEEVKWWEWSVDKIVNNRNFFNSKLSVGSFDLIV